MLCFFFFCYNINTDLLLMVQIFNLWMGDSFIFLKKLNNEVTIMFLGEKKYTCIEEFFHPFFFKQWKYEITFEFQKDKVACRNVFVILI